MSGPLWRILVADDDPTVGLLACAALAGSGFLPTVVDSGSAALAAFRCEAFDIALLDVEMPGMDGLEVGAAIRRLRGEAFPIVLVTGRDDGEFLQRARLLAATHIAKPVDWRTLPETLQQILGVV